MTTAAHKAAALAANFRADTAALPSDEAVYQIFEIFLPPGARLRIEAAAKREVGCILQCQLA
jgi:hypothetical protein